MRSRWRRDERGSSLVEFALVAPLLFMLLLGILTGGTALSHKLDLSTAAREAARYAATLPDNEFGSGDGADWASAVATEAVDQASGSLGVSGATVCVALVTGSSATVYDPSGGSAYFYSSSGGSAGQCYDDGGADSETRVQVVVTRPDELQAVVFKQSLTLTASADARFESSL